MPTRAYSILIGILLLSGGILGACSSASDSEGPGPHVTDTLSLETTADSIAADMMEAHGATAFASAPYLRFNFGVETPEGERVIARHFWDRTSGNYRLEWTTGPDSSYVALVNVQQVNDDVPAGEAYLNGQRLEGAASTSARETAYGRFINDTYWLLAPLKVFDPGVNRRYAADSSNSEHHVVHVTFGDVGLTPGDEYWLYVSRETGRLDRWAYHLEGMEEDAPPRKFDWTAYTELSAPRGSVTLASRKEAVGAKQALLTDSLALPSSAPDGIFSNPDPMLAGTDEGE